MRSYQSLEVEDGSDNREITVEQQKVRSTWMKSGTLLAVVVLVICGAIFGVKMNGKVGRLNKVEKLVAYGDATVSAQCGETFSGTIATSGAREYYQLTVPNAPGGIVTLDTCGSALDTWLYVYEGTQTTSATWNCDDCGPCGWQTVQSFVISSTGSALELKPNTLYTIGVGGYSTRTGSFTLKIKCDVTCGHTLVGSVAPNKKVGYEFVVPAQIGGSVTMSTCASNFDTWLYTYVADSNGNDVERYSCDDCGHTTCGTGVYYRTNQVFSINSNGVGAVPSGGTGSTALEAGRKYSIRVGGYRSATGQSNLVISCGAPPATTAPPAPTCAPNVRRDWNDLSQSERDLFLNGFKALRDNGRLGVLTSEHTEAFELGIDNAEFHNNDAFLPWHRLFLVELEQQIRALGGSYACVSIPYWDWTRTAGELVANNPMWNQNLGGNGVGAGRCVQTGLLREGQYVTSTGGCLRRNFRGGSNNYPTVQQALGGVESGQSYTAFRDWLEDYHDNTHMSIGGGLASVNSATDDPLFWMLHNYVDMVWAMRSDCHNLGTEQSSQNYPNTTLRLTYPIAAQQSWSMFNGASFTVADALTTSQWGYTFDASTMLSRSGMSMSACTWNEIQHGVVSDWNVRENGDGELAWKVNAHVRAKVAADAGTTDAQKVTESCVSEQKWQVAQGIRSQVCSYGGVTLETCGEGGRLMISLADLLKKRGVAGNGCIEEVRKSLYSWAVQTGNLRGLCNGKADPVC